jgi:hypothetical protein
LALTLSLATAPSATSTPAAAATSTIGRRLPKRIDLPLNKVPIVFAIRVIPAEL